MNCLFGKYLNVLKVGFTIIIFIATGFSVLYIAQNQSLGKGTIFFVLKMDSSHKTPIFWVRSSTTGCFDYRLRTMMTDTTFWVA